MQAARNFLFAILFALVLPSHAEEADVPNILWITAEDLSPNLGCYGDAFARTPNLDRLAEESVRYTNAFATAPVCSPARFCLLTGVYATSAGTQRLRSDFPIPDTIQGFPTILRQRGFFCTNNVKTDYNTSAEPRLIKASWDTSSARAHWRDRPSRQGPFFAVFNDMRTHQSRTTAWDHPEFVKKVQSELGDTEIHDPSGASVPPYYPDTPTVRETIARYHDCITAMDKNVGRILSQLEEDGLAEDTIVFFFSDHGAGLPRHKRLLYDSGMHVPLLVRFPKRFQHLAPSAAGTDSDRLVSFVDFAPTVLSLVGERAPAWMQGRPFLGPLAVQPRTHVFGARDRVDEAEDIARSVRTKDFLYIRNFMPHLSANQPSAYSDQGAIRQEITALAQAGRLDPTQMAYAGKPRPREELYDVRRDPHQTRNLAGDPTYSETLSALSEELRRWIKDSGDLGFFTEFEARYHRPRSVADDVLETAWLSGAPNATPTLLDRTSHKDPSVRFWATLGLGITGSGDSATQDALHPLLDDPSPPVRIEAARILGETGVASALLDDDRPEVVLAAARALELYGGTDPEIRQAMKDALTTWLPRRDETPLALFISFSLETALGIPVTF